MPAGFTSSPATGVNFHDLPVNRRANLRLLVFDSGHPRAHGRGGHFGLGQGHVDLADLREAVEPLSRLAKFLRFGIELGLLRFIVRGRDHRRLLKRLITAELTLGVAQLRLEARDLGALPQSSAGLTPAFTCARRLCAMRMRASAACQPASSCSRLFENGQHLSLFDVFPFFDEQHRYQRGLAGDGSGRDANHMAVGGCARGRSMASSAGLDERGAAAGALSGRLETYAAASEIARSTTPANRRRGRGRLVVIPA